MGVCVHNDVIIHSSLTINTVDNIKAPSNIIDLAYQPNPTDPATLSNTLNFIFNPINPYEQETRMTLEIPEFSSSPMETTIFKEKTSTHNKVFKRIHIFGPRQSGKSSFLIRVCEKRFENFYIPSIFEEQSQCKCVINGYRRNIEFKVKLFENFSPNTINQNDIIFVFFDESNEKSLLQAKQFIAFIRNIEYLNRIQLYLIGNKCELKKYLDDEQQLTIFCNAYNAKLFHISVKNNTGIPNLLKSLN